MKTFFSRTVQTWPLKSAAGFPLTLACMLALSACGGGPDRTGELIDQAANSGQNRDDGQEIGKQAESSSVLWSKEYGFGAKLGQPGEINEKNVEWPQPGGPNLPYTIEADRLIVFKSKRRLFVIDGNRPVKAYSIALGFEPEGPKKWQGDGRTPEGSYYITHKNPNSRFHLSLGISYPNSRDRELARSLGLDPGGDIMIHGMPNRYDNNVRQFHPDWDWTSGCLAVDDPEIEELWRVVPVGTPIDIFP